VTAESKKGNMVKCLICGAVFDASLKECPVCGVGPENFIPYEEEEELKPKPGKKAMVKCLICGAVFDASLKECPVCGAGAENFVPYEEETTEYKKDTGERYLILGNGAAGISAAEAIRERNETCKITMISNEPVYSYIRPQLTKKLVTIQNAEEIAVHKKDWYDKNHIDTILGASVVKIEPENKSVTLDDGRSIPYDKCIYALGAECFIPPIKGVDKSGVFAIRRISDIQQIQNFSGKISNITVVGGGVLGLEAAWQLRNFGKVTILEAANRLMNRQLDEKAGQFLGNIIRSEGFDFRLNASITELLGDDSVTGVALGSGEVIPADLVIISCGVRSNTEIAKKAGIAVERSVVVNERMETNIPDIYACGDCAAYKGVNYALWSQAIGMGKVAGANAAGDDLEYVIEPSALTFDAMNTSLFAAGDNGMNPALTYRWVEEENAGKRVYKKFYFVDDRLTGVILIGDLSNLDDIQKALNERRYYHEMFPRRDE